MAQYPSAAGTDANLFVAANNLSTSLSDNPLTSGATTVNVASTTGFPTAGYITIDAEAISYTGVTGTSFTGCTRGADGTTAASHLTATTVFHDVVAAHHNVLKDEIKAIEGDLVACLASLALASPGNTATSILNRINQLSQQLKNITGTTNWYDSVAKNLTQLLPLSGGTMSGAIAMGTSKITGLGNGTAAQDAAAYSQLKVLQVQHHGDTSGFTTTSTSFVATNTSLSITPRDTNSTIIIIASGSLGISRADHTPAATIARNGTNLGDASFGFCTLDTSIGSGTATQMRVPAAMVVRDSPASASAVTYAVYAKVDNSSFTTTWGLGQQFIVAIEIAG